MHYIYAYRLSKYEKIMSDRFHWAFVLGLFLAIIAIIASFRTR